MMSKRVPPATRRIMTTMYVFMIVGDTNVDSSAKGLVVNIR
jgi:hypothetical protein